MTDMTETHEEEMGVLFEKGCGKWVELIPGGKTRFHSSKEFATHIPVSKFQAEIEFTILLGEYGIQRLYETIVFQPLSPIKVFDEQSGPRI